MTTLRETLGRPRDTDLNRRILDETRIQLVRDGYAGLGIERIVNAVGCGKSALYRRYPDKAELVAATVIDAVGTTTEPDTGTLRGDLLLLPLTTT